MLSFRAYAIDFNLQPVDTDINGATYYKLVVRYNGEVNHIDIPLEGNANTAEIKERLWVLCPWGKAEGVKTRMVSSTDDGVMVVNGFYYFDKHLENVFSKNFITFGRDEFNSPVSISHAVCNRVGGYIKLDDKVGKGYVSNNEIIAQGPFKLKGVPNVYIKYVMSEDLEFIRENSLGEIVIDKYQTKNNITQEILSVVFMKVYSTLNVVNLVSWKDKEGKKCYKVYVYGYDANGDFISDAKLNNDPNLIITTDHRPVNGSQNVYISTGKKFKKNEELSNVDGTLYFNSFNRSLVFNARKDCCKEYVKYIYKFEGEKLRLQEKITFNYVSKIGTSNNGNHVLQTYFEAY